MLHPKCKAFVTVAGVVLAAVMAACSTTKPTAPAIAGGVSAGDSVNLSGTYNLAAFTGGTIDSTDGAVLTLTKTTYKLQPDRLVRFASWGPTAGRMSR